MFQLSPVLQVRISVIKYEPLQYTGRLLRYYLNGFTYTPCCTLQNGRSINSLIVCVAYTLAPHL